MYLIYHHYHQKIEFATKGTEIPPEYMGALISLESHPPGNWDSQRFEPKIYERLLRLKYNNEPFSYIPKEKVASLTEEELRQLATSYGPTQIMGYHCLELGCSIDDLKGENHLLWSIAFIRKHYLKCIVQKKWDVCFRIHNTGKPDGNPHNKDYVEKGLKRMAYYKKWMEFQGNLVSAFFSRANQKKEQ